MLRRLGTLESQQNFFAIEVDNDDWQKTLKRLTDIAFAGAALIALLPLLMIIAMLIATTSPGPVIFRQRRHGYDNQIFGIYKFRTMYMNAPGSDGAIQAVAGDPRVTWIGTFLRRWSLDELPQLFNVLQGDMSMVGPRPHPVQMKAAGHPIEAVVPNYAVRHCVRPGITGWAQVKGWRGDTTTIEKAQKRIECDLFYICHWSILLDFKILAMTLPAVLSGRNAV